MAKTTRKTTTTKRTTTAKTKTKTTAKKPKPVDKKAPARAKTIVAKTTTAKTAEIPPMATNTSPRLLMKSFVPKAIVGGFQKDEFEAMAKKHFAGHSVKVEFFNARQCYVSVDGHRVQRNGEDGVFIGRAV